ncbi:MAG: hypothetical protein K0R09_1696 [Clostridiales bacterium]|jgi:hypothetical protein|nr:hypothetical protein [Clostridiales bacterium]
MKFASIINKLLSSEEPSIRWRTRVNILGQSRESSDIISLENEIKNSNRVRTLLKNRTDDGKINNFRGVYDKWQGAHWILISLSDIGYPKGDLELIPISKQVSEYWLQKRFFNEYVVESKEDAYKKRDAIPIMQGRHRTCASQQGYPLYSILKLGLQDDNIHKLAKRLIHWQWPDGGWNCDKRLEAKTSTFIHTLYCMRGLFMYSKVTGDSRAGECALRAADVILSRKLFLRLRDGRVMNEEFTKLHFPLYWHYDILSALKVFAEFDLIDDPRCIPALDLLESKRLPDGGWPAEGKYYTVNDKLKLNADYVGWGGTSKKTYNEWVTTDALYVLSKVNRIY